MAYQQPRAPPRRPPPVRQYTNGQPPPTPNGGRQDHGQGGYDDYGAQYNGYDRHDGYQYDSGPYDARGDYPRHDGHYPQQRRPGPPPQGHYGYRDDGYMNRQRPPPPGQSGRRPPPHRQHPNQSSNRAPKPAKPMEGPFPPIPTKKEQEKDKRRRNSADLNIDKGVAALNINDRPTPDVRPHTSNSNRPRPTHHNPEPLPPLNISRSHGGPKGMPEGAGMGTGPPRPPMSPRDTGSPGGMAPPKRSATMPVNQPTGSNQPQYPGQLVWQEPPPSPGPNGLNNSKMPPPPRPSTTTGVRPSPTPAPPVPSLPADKAKESSQKDDYDDSFLNEYFDNDSEPDMPNFGAMEDTGSSNPKDESLIPFDKPKGPGKSQQESKPGYTAYAAYQPKTEPAQPAYQEHNAPDQYGGSNHQYDYPQRSPQYDHFPQGAGYGYPPEDPYRGTPVPRGTTPRPNQRGPPGGRPDGYGQQQYPPPMPGNGGYGRGYQDQHEMPMANQGNPDALPQHPAPFRPGLDSKPVPVRQYDAAPPVARQQMQTPAPPQGNMPQDTGPLTFIELQRIQAAARNNPSDQAAQLFYAKKLVEASVHLIDDNGRADARTKAKNRERYNADAHKVVKKLVSGGYAPAMFYMADCYGQGLLGLQSDPKEAFALYQSGAKIGHAECAYRLAVCCEMGHEGGGGTRRDPMKAVQWYRRAAALGDTPAMYKMGMILLKGLLGQQRNPREALSWLKRAAERADEENPHALHELALLYENPGGNDAVIRDEVYARELLQQAAELNYKFSQHRLGSAYEHGFLGCPVDPRQSIFWYSRAAAQGEHQSELALSGWYLTGGDGILQQSDTEAYLWARKAAMAGLAKAEYAMGYFTEVGIGVPANLEDAKRWYWKASSQNFVKARERLEDLKRGGAKMQKTRVSRSAVNRQNEGDCVVM